MSCGSKLAMGLLHLATRRSIIYAVCMMLLGMEHELKCIVLNMQRNVNTAEILSRIPVLPYVICSDNNLNSKEQGIKKFWPVASSQRRVGTPRR